MMILRLNFEAIIELNFIKLSTDPCDLLNWKPLQWLGVPELSQFQDLKTCALNRLHDLNCQIERN